MILVACEYSGVVRDAFIAAGREAMSCDILPTESAGPHYEGDVRDIINDDWEMIVAHPPCTRLCRAGRRWLSGAGDMTHPKVLPRGRSWASMKAEFTEGLALLSDIWDAPCDRVAIENPIMHDIARRRLAFLPKPEVVQPFWFGDPAYKATGWYLRGLPPLVETDRLVEPVRGSDEWKKWSAIHRAPPGPNRARERSRFFPGMATAIGEQW